MRTLQAHGFTQLHRERAAPACLAIGTVAGLSSVRLVISPSIFLEPFAPPELPGFLATMVPLTPVSLLSGGKQVSLLHKSQLPSIPSPNTPSTPEIALTRYPSASQASRSGFGLRHYSAGSPFEKAESSSLLLRTGLSLTGVSHPASRRRSSSSLQAGERLPEKDLHLSVRTHLQTHGVLRLDGALAPVAKDSRRRESHLMDG